MKVSINELRSLIKEILTEQAELSREEKMDDQWETAIQYLGKAIASSAGGKYSPEGAIEQGQLDSINIFLPSKDPNSRKGPHVVVEPYYSNLFLGVWNFPEGGEKVLDLFKELVSGHGAQVTVQLSKDDGGSIAIEEGKRSYQFFEWFLKNASNVGRQVGTFIANNYRDDLK